MGREVEGGFDGTVELCRMVRMLDVWVMVCRVCERSVRRPWASDFSFCARREAMMCVRLSTMIISMPGSGEVLSRGGLARSEVSSSSLSNISGR